MLSGTAEANAIRDPRRLRQKIAPGSTCRLVRPGTTDVPLCTVIAVLGRTFLSIFRRTYRVRLLEHPVTLIVAEVHLDVVTPGNPD